jgi:hypothetical protein
MTLSIMTFSTMTSDIKYLNVTLSLSDSHHKSHSAQITLLSITTLCHYAACTYGGSRFIYCNAECRYAENSGAIYAPSKKISNNEENGPANCSMEMLNKVYLLATFHCLFNL